jgi:predicted transcriptional regulator of viral defense system
MPIDIDRFEEGSNEELRANGPTNAEQLLAFLAAHPEQAFTPKELHEATGMPRGSVGVVLSRLDDHGLVRHRGEYWAIAEDTDVETTLSAMRAAETMTDRFGPEDPKEWGPGADADHPEDA